MRENRPYGSEGGVAQAIPTPIRSTFAQDRRNTASPIAPYHCGRKTGDKFLG
jgi:hypothetical protein